MNAHVTYSAKRLKEPLEKLVRWLSSAIDNKTVELVKHTGGEKRQPNEARSAELARLEREIEALRLDHLDAMILLDECSASDGSGVGPWQLDAADLRWLYRYKGHESIQHVCLRRLPGK